MMMDDPPFEPDRALFARWRAAADQAAALDALPLAAYAEGRLGEAEAAPIEAALAADPALLDTLIALRFVAETAAPSPGLIATAQALVPAKANPVLVAFRPRASLVGRIAAWGAVAASLLVVSLAGFDLGVRTEHAVSAEAGYDAPADLLDPSSLAGDDIG
jgi:hypothetical protein